MTSNSCPLLLWTLKVCYLVDNNASNSFVLLRADLFCYAIDELVITFQFFCVVTVQVHLHDDNVVHTLPILCCCYACTRDMRRTGQL